MNPAAAVQDRARGNASHTKRRRAWLASLAPIALLWLIAHRLMMPATPADA